jgi:hypothetical protein
MCNKAENGHLLVESTSCNPDMFAADMRDRNNFRMFASTEFSTYNLHVHS